MYSMLDDTQFSISPVCGETHDSAKLSGLDAVDT